VEFTKTTGKEVELVLALVSSELTSRSCRTLEEVRCALQPHACAFTNRSIAPCFELGHAPGINRKPTLTTTTRWKQTIDEQRRTSAPNWCRKMDGRHWELSGQWKEVTFLVTKTTMLDGKEGDIIHFRFTYFKSDRVAGGIPALAFYSSEDWQTGCNTNLVLKRENAKIRRECDIPCSTCPTLRVGCDADVCRQRPPWLEGQTCRRTECIPPPPALSTHPPPGCRARTSEFRRGATSRRSPAAPACRGRLSQEETLFFRIEQHDLNFGWIE
jgi:hypothetical protein